AVHHGRRRHCPAGRFSLRHLHHRRRRLRHCPLQWRPSARQRTLSRFLHAHHSGRIHKKRPIPSSHLAAGSHVRADTRQRLPALRHHGQGRHLSACPPPPRSWRHRPVVLGAFTFRADHH